jgi:hypothetical protein
MLAWWRGAVLGVMVALLPSVALAQAALAEGFKKVPSGAKVVLMPMDVELFSVSAGGILEPQAEWTSQALEHLKSAYQAKKDALGVEMLQLDDDGDEVVEDFNRLHGAVGTAIARHHYGAWRLPTKEGHFDWTLGEGVDAIRTKTGADYALFTYVRDSYASSGRVAAMVIGALFGVGLGGGMQVGYASLVDLRDGRVVWFNLLVRASGDLREAEKARETLTAMLNKFPG